ncbi:tetratricopeptide repeat protein [Bacteriovorax sp. Seq25_V]|nr:tetratricopeptide repeat protein [Bacteriovorax sp. Seq25_V]
MKKRNVLTFITFLALSCWSTSAKIVEAESNDGFFRVKVYTNKELIKISRLGKVLTLKTLDSEVFGSLKKELEAVKNSPYVQSVKELEPVEGNAVFSVNINLKDDVEIFSFYKNRDVAYYIDFWKDGGTVSQKSAAVKAEVPAAKIAPVVKKPAEIKKVVRVKPIAAPIVKKEKTYRDFRYGASFIWDYAPILPKISKTIFLDRKTPEFFYPIEDRKFDKDDKEAHMQLSINLYRKKKWGLMAKSIKLYEEKYKDDANFTMNEYLKANALLRESSDAGDIKPIDTAVAMFSNIAEKTPVYEFRRGIYKYLIQYYLEKQDSISTLKYAKRFFADAKENFDYEELEYATELMLLSLSNLNQIDKIKSLISEKTIQKILPKQKQIAYEMYTYLKLGDEEQVIKLFENFTKSTKGDLLPSLYFNAAEAYFRTAEYQKSIAAYDNFLSKYSFHSASSAARLRVALASDILERKESEVEELYKNAINRSQAVDISLEARIRYVGLRAIRKIKPTTEDKEVKVFLDKGEQSNLTPELERLLWLTRLRSFIVDGNYQDALTFLTALPLAAMDSSFKVVFEGDGAEVVYGIIKKSYDNGEYAKSIRAWEIYKSVYFEKVAADPEIQFIIAKSYANLGLWEGFQKIYELIGKTKEQKSRTYPIWLTRTTTENADLIEKQLQILRNVKLGNWSSVEKLTNEMDKVTPGNAIAQFYRAMALYGQKNFSQAETAYERFFSKNVNFDIIDGKDLVDSVVNYLESIYEQAKYAKFIDVSDALVKDASSFKVDKAVVHKMKDRVGYLRLEIMFSQNKADVLEEANKFVKDFKDSSYLNRIKFLLGRENLRLRKFDEGEKILTDLMNSTSVESYIKEMARSELTLLNLKKRTL